MKPFKRSLLMAATLTVLPLTQGCALLLLGGVAAGATYGDLAALCNTTAEHRGSATRQVAVTIEAAVPMAGRWLHSAVAGLAGQASPSLTSIPLYAFIPTFRQRNDTVSRH